MVIYSMVESVKEKEKHQLNKHKKTGSRKFEPILTPQKDRQTLKKGEPPLPSMGLVYLPTFTIEINHSYR